MFEWIIDNVWEPVMEFLFPPRASKWVHALVLLGFYVVALVFFLIIGR